MSYEIKTILLITLFTLSACFGNSKPTHFYVLAPLAEKGIIKSKAPKKSGVVLVGPLEMAKYLDRTNVVQRIGQNEMVVSDFESWAEGLDKAIARVIAQNISNTLGEDSFAVSPWQSLAEADIEIPLAIDRFDCDNLGNCYFTAYWSIRDRQGKVYSPLSVHSFTKEAQSASVADQTAALSQILADASKVIAKELAKVN